MNHLCMVDVLDGALPTFISHLPVKDALQLSAVCRLMRTSVLTVLTHFGIQLTRQDTASQLDFLCKFPSLRSIILNRDDERPRIQVTAPQLLRIGALPSLRELHIHRCNFHSIAPLTQLSQLLRLDLNKCTVFTPENSSPVEGEPLDPLTSLISLQHLGLHACFPMMESSLLVLAQLPALTSLKVSKFISRSGPRCICHEGELLLGHLAQLTNLQQLELSDLEGEHGWQQIACLRALRHLDLKGCTGGNQVLPHLTQLTHLQHLSISGVDADGLPHLLAVQTLECLKLYGCELAAEHLPPLAGLTGLQLLELQGHSFTDDSMAVLAACPRLSHLQVRDNEELTDAGLAHLPLGLTCLLLEECTSITGQGLARLSLLTSLKQLSLEMSTVGGWMVHLSSLTSLQSLNLGGCGLTDASMPYLSRLTLLTMLSLDGCSNVHAGELHHLSAMHHLQSACLYSNAVSPGGLVHLASIPTLQHLELYGRELHDTAGLQHLSRLTYLALSAPDGLGAQVLPQVASIAGLRQLLLNCLLPPDTPPSCLLTLTNLQDLSLACRYAESQLVVNLPGMLDALPQLDKLRLHHCRVDVTALEHTPCLANLRFLKLHGVAGLDDASVARIAQLRGLEKLSVEHSGEMTVDSLQHLTALASLRRLDLRCCTHIVWSALSQRLTLLECLFNCGLQLNYAHWLHNDVEGQLA